MENYEKHIQVLRRMQCCYDHIRRTDDEWEATQAAIEVFTEKIQQETNKKPRRSG